VKTALKGKRCQDEDINKNMMAELNPCSFGGLCWLFSKTF
jgi:hypothetical protein